MKEIELKSGKKISLNQAFNMDCLEFMPLIPDKSIDMILCDLPYGTTACKWDVIIPFEPLWEQYKRIIKDNGAIVLTAAQPFTTDVIMSNREWFKYCWVWDKIIPSGMSYARFQPMRQHEDIIIFSNGKLKYNPQMTKRDIIIKSGGMGKSGSAMTEEYKPLNKTYEFKSPTTILKFDKIRNGGIHPTQKPFKLFQYLIETYTDKDDLVFDNCLGSFTTGVAAHNTGRNWLGTEMDEQIFTSGYHRYEQETKQMLMEF